MLDAGDRREMDDPVRLPALRCERAVIEDIAELRMVLRQRDIEANDFVAMTRQPSPRRATHKALRSGHKDTSHFDTSRTSCKRLFV
jgi:hypothetical protein